MGGRTFCPAKRDSDTASGKKDLCYNFFFVYLQLFSGLLIMTTVDKKEIPIQNWRVFLAIIVVTIFGFMNWRIYILSEEVDTLTLAVDFLKVDVDSIQDSGNDLGDLKQRVEELEYHYREEFLKNY
jgi:hypothetical protein